MDLKTRITAAAAVLVILASAACASAASSPTPIPVREATLTPSPQPTPTAVPHNLVVCLGQEPSTLFAYKGSSRSMWSVLEAVYDGPFDTLQSGAKPVILEKVPSLKDGDAVIAAVDIKAGSEVVDADGNLTNLTEGKRVIPSGCAGPDCAVAWDGKSSLQMDQLSMTYKLRSGITWSDGAPLNVADSVYSYQLSGNEDIPVSKNLVSRTVSYTAVDDLSVKWIGIPGFIPNKLESLFWIPMPKHAWEKMTAKALLDSDEANKKPLGWGPYIISEWVQGDHISLTKNPQYFRANEGLPKFDKLVFRFLGEPADNNLAALQSGECDVVDQTSLLEEQLEPILELQRDKKLMAYIQQGPEWEQVNFGIRPATYDAGATLENRPDFFGDLRTRQAFRMCMNRAGLINKPLENQTSIPVGFYPQGSPLFLSDVQAAPFDAAGGSRLLDEVGWKDLDGDPKTPRTAVGIQGVPEGTPLTVNYVTTKAPLRMETAKQLTSSLAECGIQVNVQYMDPNELYAPGPDGPLFGRKFDLAEFGWEAGTQSPCWLFDTTNLPDSKNNWVGVNITGYLNPEFDQACKTARQARPDQADYLDKQLAVQRLFAEGVPAVPLYFRLKMAVSRPDFCGMELDTSARSLLWNLETLDYGKNCAK
jgi:peptide/nickel transport system substrate-binding protein